MKAFNRSLPGILGRPGLKYHLASAVFGPVSALINSAAHALGWIPEPAQVREIRLPVSGLPKELEGYTILHLSDFHIGTWITRLRLAELVDRANKLQPDLIAITGDYVADANSRSLSAIESELSRLQAEDGVFGVMGNHDHWAGVEAVRRALNATGIQDVGNDSRYLCSQKGRINVAGIDAFYDGGDRLYPVLESLRPADFNLILCHEPDYADLVRQTGRFDLQLSGHSHGGQIAFPKIGPLFLPSHARRYPAGLYTLGRLWLNTSVGLGTARLQLRWNAPAEMILLTLQAAA